MSVKKKDVPGVVAVFEYLDDVTKVMHAIGERDDFRGHLLYSFTSYHELMDIAEKRYGGSAVRWFALIGGLTGATTGFSLALLCDWDWPIVVGGKTAGIYSLPAYFIFGFELMVLFGALSTIAGIFVCGRFPNPKARIVDERTTDDRFAIFVPGASVEGEQARYLKENGALEVFASS